MPSRILKFLASLKLAVIVICLIATMIAIGTFVEAHFNDAEAASKLVYRTPWMFIVMGLFAVNLIAVMVDRWPWKRRHLSFILAHIGILVLLLGSLVTMKWGLDGSMPIRIGESSKFVSSPVTDLIVWSSFDGEKYAKLFEQEVDFFLDRPEKKPVSFQTDAGPLEVREFKPYMLASRRVKESSSGQGGAAVQFQIQNARVNVTEWLVQEKSGALVNHDFGPAQIFLGTDPGQGSGRNEIYLEPQASGKIKYTIYNKEKTASKKGLLAEGDTLETGWMGLQLRVLQYLPRAEYVWEFKEASRKSELTNAAIRLSFQGKDHWVQMDDVLKIFTEKAVYIVTYGHRRIDIGFDVHLKDFSVGRYPGTTKAATYQSVVDVPGVSGVTISMNEPLKHDGLTIYQASFSEDPKTGEPVASVFSVNYDPGRWMKYLGSLIITIGVVVLFYDRRKSAKAAMAPRKQEQT